MCDEYFLDLSIILPCYNEASRGNLKDRLNKLIDYMYEQTNITYEIILVNDGSTDNTLEVIKDIAELYTNIRVLSYSRNVGKSNAVRLGIKCASGKYTLMMDTDMSIPLKYIDSFYKYITIATQHQMVIGVRDRSHEHRSFIRKGLSFLAHTTTKFLLGIDIKDTQCGFKMFETARAQSIVKYIKSNRWLIDIELIMYIKATGTKVKCMTVVSKDRLQSTLNSKEALKSSIKELLIILVNKHKTIKMIKINNKVKGE